MSGAGVGTKRQELSNLVTGIPVTKRKVGSLIFSDDIQGIQVSDELSISH